MLEGVIPGMEDPVIYIGVVEKGWAMLELSVKGEQKHSSTPPRESATGMDNNRDSDELSFIVTER